ncbi:MAG TPA: NAD-dependent epimerase/dehydratase family protein [Egibacteraceae bacterium]|nr:NAD-dependent epimerase/dehydratase family protein [Egibacteraceae bacterium]
MVALSDAHVAILGGAGFLGSHLCDRLVALGAKVTVLDNFITGRPDNVEHLVGTPAFRLVSYDVTDFLHVPGRLDHILHFASPASPADYLRWPIQTLKVGALGTHKALGLARAKQARLLLASTSEVYGDPEVNPQPETYWGHVNPTGPRGVYDEAKRFAEAMCLAYHRQHGVDVRIARIFNSILADEQVLYDDGTQLRREPVEMLARRLEASAQPNCLRVPAFDTDGRIRPAVASALVGHPTAATCYEVRTRYGRSVRVTGDHSLFVEGPDGRPEARAVTSLSLRDRVALAATVRVPERDRQLVHMAEVWDAANLDPWDLLVHAPGLGGTAWALPLGALRELAVAPPQGPEVYVSERGSKVRLPACIAVSDELLWLLGLLVAGGRRQDSSPDGFLAVSGDDELLARAAKIFQRDLALDVTPTPASGGRSGAMFVRSRLLLVLLDHLGLPAGAERVPGWVLGLPLSRLKWFLEGYRAADGMHAGRTLQEAQRHEFCTVSAQLKDDLVVALGRFGLVPSVGYDETARPGGAGRRSPLWRLTVCDVHPWSPLGWDGGVTQRLDARRSHDLVWADVTSIRQIEPSELVYDFCVPGFENFWAGVGVMVHNTYGPRMRVDDGRAVPAFFTAALLDRPLPVHGDGSQTRSLCYVDDMVEGLLRLLVSDYAGPVNLGNPREVTVLQLAEAVQTAVGRHPGVRFLPRPPDDPSVRCPDTGLAEKLLAWKAEVTLAQGLARTAGWFRDRLGQSG